MFVSPLTMSTYEQLEDLIEMKTITAIHLHFFFLLKTTMSVPKKTEATVEGIFRWKELSKILKEYLVENKLDQSEEVASQNVELSLREKNQG